MQERHGETGEGDWPQAQGVALQEQQQGFQEQENGLHPTNLSPVLGAAPGLLRQLGDWGPGED